MTYEEFKRLAEHPQHRDIPAIFKLEVIETEELPEKKQKEQDEKDRIYKQSHDASIRNKEPTALCPYCHIDSVIGDAAGFPIIPKFLKAMNKRWF